MPVIDEFRIPIGFCTVTYGDSQIKHMANSALFEAVPKFSVFRKGINEKVYLLEDYNVSLSVSLSLENYQTLTLALPYLKPLFSGYYDMPVNVDTDGKPLIIHPNDAGNSKDYDICIFRAIVDPEQSFRRTYDKQQDSINIRFIGLPGKQLNGEKRKSYFFIGDWEAAGVIDD